MNIGGGFSMRLKFSILAVSILLPLQVAHAFFVHDPQTLPTTAYGTLTGVAVDLNNDGYSDVAIAGFRQLEFWLNDKSGIFTGSMVAPIAGARPAGLAVGLFNADAYADVFVAGRSAAGGLGPSWVLMGNGDGTFTDSGQRLGNGVSDAVASGDLNGDGYADALVCNNGTTINNQSPYNEVWMNDGTGVFSLSSTIVGPLFGNKWPCNDVKLADIDLDGDLDAAFGMKGPNSIWLNDGLGNFTDSGQFALSGSTTTTQALALGDLNSDGYADMVTAENDNFRTITYQIYFNDKLGNMILDATQQFSYPGSPNRRVYIADLNMDAYSDVWIPSAGTVTQQPVLLLNDGTGILSVGPDATGGVIYDGLSSGIADFDLDGDVDVFNMDGGTGNHHYLRNDLIGTGPSYIGSGPNSPIAGGGGNTPTAGTSKTSDSGGCIVNTQSKYSLLLMLVLLAISCLLGGLRRQVRYEEVSLEWLPMTSRGKCLVN